MTQPDFNTDAEEDDEEDAFNQEEEDERVEETGWDDESVRSNNWICAKKRVHLLCS